MVKDAKRSRLYFDLLCLSISIKMMSGSSRYKIKTLKKFMSDFGLNSKKAKILLDEARSNSSLFRFDEDKNTLIAKTYKHNCTITNDKKGRRIYQMYCMKMNIGDNFKIGYIKREIRKLLILCAVNISERMDKFQSRIYKPCRKSDGVFSLQNFAHIAGVTRKTVTKYVNQLKDESRLNVHKGELCDIVERVDIDTILKAKSENKYVMITRQGYGCIYHNTRYSIANRSVNDSFVNIIFNHSKRLTYNAPKNNVNIMDTELMGAYN